MGTFCPCLLLCSLCKVGLWQWSPDRHSVTVLISALARTCTHALQLNAAGASTDSLPLFKNGVGTHSHRNNPPATLQTPRHMTLSHLVELSLCCCCCRLQKEKEMHTAPIWRPLGRKLLAGDGLPGGSGAQPLVREFSLFHSPQEGGGISSHSDCHALRKPLKTTPHSQVIHVASSGPFGNLLGCISMQNWVFFFRGRSFVE